MIRTRLAVSVAFVTSVSLVFSCSSATAPADAQTDSAADARTDRAADALTDAGAHDARARDAIVSVDAIGDAAGDSGAASLDWYPGNYGLTDTTNHTARDAFLKGTLASAFDGVELIYPWTTCESGTTMGDYSACFTAIDGDLAATPATKHILLLLQYKAFGSGVDAVPAYLRGPGPWCETSGTTQVCGQYPTPKAAIAMIWNGEVAARFQAWVAALGARYGHSDKIAGIALPETATGAGGKYSLASVGFTSKNYLDAIKANLLAVKKAFPTKPVFQYINFIQPPVAVESADLKSLGDWALMQRNIGLGCPDVGGNSSFHPPGYDTLINAKYQLHLPFNVAIEPMDYGSKYTLGLKETYAEATDLAPDGGMAAQFVVWWYELGKANVFTIDDVAKYLPTHANPNMKPPTY